MIGNLGLCKRSKIYLFQNFQKHCHGTNSLKNRFGKERYIKQINYIWEWQKKMAGFPCSAQKGDVGKESGVSTHSFAYVMTKIMLLPIKY